MSKSMNTCRFSFNSLCCFTLIRTVMCIYPPYISIYRYVYRESESISIYLPILSIIHVTINCLLLSNSDSAACYSEPIAREASGRKERCFNQKSWQTGEEVDLGPEINSSGFCPAMTIFKGKTGEWSLSGLWRQEIEFCIILLWVQIGWLFLQMLSCLHDLRAR